MKSSLSSRILNALALSVALPFCGMTVASAVAYEAKPEALPRKVFAHYMGCYPVGFGALRTESIRAEQAKFRPDGPSYVDRIGGRWRDFALTPQDYAPTREQAADLEIRRAMRMGLDGFAIDVLAGDQAALDNLDALFKAAEEHKYPFQITFCLDGPGLNANAVRYLFEKHKNSPNLARRNGKPLFLGYHSQRWARVLRPELTDADLITPAGIAVQCEYLKTLETIAGEPFHSVFCMELLAGAQRKKLENDAAFWNMTAKEFAKGYSGWSVFFATAADYATPAKAAREAGMDWGEAVWPQYQSTGWNVFHLKDGSELIRDSWERAIKNDATMVQIATWNDYTESTNVAPGQQTSYAIGDLNGILIQRWKTGKWPQFDKDRIYFFYPLYPKGSRVYPFHDFASDITGPLEVVTYLTKPGKIVMPGRNESWEAPAGLFCKKLPVTPGPILAELYRGKEKVTSLASREPITDRPFRAQHSIVSCCTEDARYWQEDFPGVTAKPVSYYGDDDGDGLPNWFEMYYAGKLGDFSVATALQPNDKAPGSDKTYLQAYLAQVDPLKPETAPKPGTVWNLLDNPRPNEKGIKCGLSTNPERDSDGHDIWSYQSSVGSEPWALLPSASINRFNGEFSSIGYSRASRNIFGPKLDYATLGTISYRWTRLDQEWKEWKTVVLLTPSANERVGVQWVTPADGTYLFDLAVALPNGPSSGNVVNLTSAGKSLWSATLGSSETSAQKAQKLTLKKGDAVRLEASQVSGSKSGVEISRFNVTFQPKP